MRMSAIIKDKPCISSINLMFILSQIYIFIKNNASCSHPFYNILNRIVPTMLRGLNCEVDEYISRPL